MAFKIALLEPFSTDSSKDDTVDVDTSLASIRDEVREKKGKNKDSTYSLAQPSPSIASDGRFRLIYRDRKIIQLPSFFAEEKEAAKACRFIITGN